MADHEAPDVREFLRSRRARINPADAGLSLVGGRRRVPGLRREEVALLAGISAEYYERIERGRVAPSSSVLEAIGRALRLTDLERRHLLALVAPVRPPLGHMSRPAAPSLRSGLRRAVDSITDTPVLVLGPRTDVLATNALGAAFYHGLEELPASEQNILRWLFTVESTRSFYDDWADTARKTVAGLRVYAATHRDDPTLLNLVAELTHDHAEFDLWWNEHDVNIRDHGRKLYHHPLVGDLELGYEAFTPVGEPDVSFGLHTVEPHSASQRALRQLASTQPLAQ